MVQKNNLKINNLISSKTLFNLIVNYLTKKGNKDLAKKIIKNALLKASRKLKRGCQYILAIAFKRLSTFVEIKDVKRRRKYLKIPFFINPRRQRYLSVKWFFNAINQNKSSLSFSEKICFELVSILKSKRAKSILLKKQNIKLASLNRSNIHFR